MTQSEKTRRLVIFGNTAFAEIAFEYFTWDSPYEVVGFTVNEAYLKEPVLAGLPVVSFERLEQHFPPEDVDIFVAVTYQQLNGLRARLTAGAKERGYALASYISSRAFVWRNVKLGEHCFVFENNVIQPFVSIGDNVILWSGNHIGHHSRIDDNCFISSHVVLSGYTHIGSNCFLGVNATIGNNVTIGQDCWFSPNAMATKNVAAGSLLSSPASEVSKVSTYRLFKVPKPGDAASP